MRFLFFGLQLPGTNQMGVGIGEEMIKRGHRVMFIVDNSIEQFLKKQSATKSFEFWSLGPGNDNVKELVSMTETPQLDLDTAYASYANSYEHFMLLIESYKEQVEQCVIEYQPDLIVLDTGRPVPFLCNKFIPWGNLVSMNVLSIGWPDFPPMFSGLSTRPADRSSWNQAELAYKKNFTKHIEHAKQMLQAEGLPPTLDLSLAYESNYFNFYCLPIELDYFAERNIRLKPNWFRFDQLTRQETNNELEEDLNQLLPNLPGKLIYFSLGTGATKNPKLVQRFLDMFAQIPHRFLASLGDFGDQLKVPTNCIGRNRWPQVSVLKQVDLFITHVGNNSFIESLAAGVPMLAVPVFLDQLDNAKRLEECNLGIQLNPVTVTQEELTNAIETSLGNTSQRERIKSIGKRIRESNNGTERAVNILEQLVTNHRRTFGSAV